MGSRAVALGPCPRVQAQPASCRPHPHGWPSEAFHPRGLGFQATEPIPRLHTPHRVTQTFGQNFFKL